MIRLVREIGRGAEGIVYEGYFNETLCALKRMKRSSGRRELIALQVCEHPHVIKVVGLSDIEGEAVVHIGLELMSKSLSTLGKLSERDAAIALKSILHALAHIHSLKWGHFDIKPSNILGTLDTPSTYKLSDFGLARQIFDSKDDKQLGDDDIGVGGGGTPHFLSPEIASLGITTTESSITTKSDIWSFAACALSLVTGALPLHATPLCAAFKLAHDRTPIDVSAVIDISETFRSLLSICLQRDPLLRPTAEELLEHEWFHLYARNEDEITISSDIRLVLPDFLLTHSPSQTSPNFSFTSSSRSYTATATTGTDEHESAHEIFLNDDQDAIDVVITAEELGQRLSAFFLLTTNDDTIESIDELIIDKAYSSNE